MKISVGSILIFSLLIGLLSVNQLFAQISQGGIPISYSDTSCLPQAGLQCITLPVMDNDSLLNADSIATWTLETKIFNFGAPVNVNLGVSNSGTWETLTDSTRLWRLHLRSAGSHSSFLIFDEFYLPEGSQFFVYSEDRTHVLGAFTNENNKPYRRLSIGPIHSESLILEYIEPKSVDTVPVINVASFIHGYKDVFKVHNSLNGSGVCNINVFCALGNGWCNQRRSVALIARLSVGHLAGFCTGALVTNDRKDSRPYFLTANHCVDASPVGVNDWLFIFNYQSPTCTNPTGPLATPFVIAGANLRASHENSDFALLELTQRPPGDFNTFYAGWDARNDRPAKGGRGIHHPSADIKKICTYTKKVKRKKKDLGNGKAKVWKIKRWSEGTTEGGSSGSPLFNPDGRIVGQLYGGTAACKSSDPSKPNKKPDFYGRFDKSWDDKSGSANRLKPWLNPSGSLGSSQLVSMTGDEPCITTYTFENSNDLHTSVNVDATSGTAPFPGDRTFNGVYECTDRITARNNVTIQPGTFVEFNAGNLILLRPDFRAQEGCVFRARIEGCLNGCNTGVGKTNLEEDTVEFIYSDVSEQDLAIDNELDEASESKENLGTSTLSIHPNPTNGYLTLRYDEYRDSEVFIYNSLGELIDHRLLVSTETNFDFSSSPRGLYFIKILSKDKTLVEKIVLQ